MWPDKLWGVRSTYNDKDDDVDDVAADNKGKSIVILDDIKGDYVKCLIILCYPMDASWSIIFSSSFLHGSKFARRRERLFEEIYARLLVIKSL